MTMDAGFFTRRTQDNAPYYQMFMDTFPGAVVLTDAMGMIVYVNDYCLNIWRDEPGTLVGNHISVFRLNGWAPETGTEHVMKTKARSILFFKTKFGDGLLTVSIPAFGENGELVGVVTFSLVEEVVYDYVKKMEMEKSNLHQLISIFNRNESTAIIAECDKMREILMFLEQIKGTDTTVMLYGESGSGKEIIAKQLHQVSARSGQPFVPINCAAIPNELIEAEFFGYEKGAFTGAGKEGKLGLFQLANKGTLFLDEIGELPFALQAKLLRVIETGEMRRIGSEKLIHTDVRIIAATNRNLQKMTQEGLFRTDLYYRLNILPIEIPPLRDREGDIEALSHSFLARYNKKYGLKRELSPRTMELFKRYAWYGNVRELKNTIERLVIISKSDIIEANEAEYPPKDSDEKRSEAPAHSLPQEEQSAVTLKEAMNRFERRYILETLDHFGGDIQKTADHLDVSRSGLYKKIAQYKG